jgi:hypothetical protein
VAGWLSLIIFVLLVSFFLLSFAALFPSLFITKSGQGVKQWTLRALIMDPQGEKSLALVKQFLEAQNLKNLDLMCSLVDDSVHCE